MHWNAGLTVQLWLLKAVYKPIPKEELEKTKGLWSDEILMQGNYWKLTGAMLSNDNPSGGLSTLCPQAILVDMQDLNGKSRADLTNQKWQKISLQNLTNHSRPSKEDTVGMHLHSLALQPQKELNSDPTSTCTPTTTSTFPLTKA